MTPEAALETAKENIQNDIRRGWLDFWTALDNAQMALTLLRQVLADPNTKIMTAYRLRLEELLK